MIGGRGAGTVIDDVRAHESTVCMKEVRNSRRRFMVGMKKKCDILMREEEQYAHDIASHGPRLICVDWIELGSL